MMSTFRIKMPQTVKLVFERHVFKEQRKMECLNVFQVDGYKIPQFPFKFFDEDEGKEENMVKMQGKKIMPYWQHPTFSAIVPNCNECFKALNFIS